MLNFWKIVFCVTLISFAFSCRSRRIVQQSTLDSVRIEKVYIEKLVSETCYVSLPNELKSSVVLDSVSFLETSLAFSTARLDSDGRLFHELENKRADLPCVVQTKQIVRDSIQIQTRTEFQAIEVERKLSWFQKFQMCGFWILALLFAVALFFLVRVSRR